MVSLSAIAEGGSSLILSCAEVANQTPSERVVIKRPVTDEDMVKRLGVAAKSILATSERDGDNGADRYRGLMLLCGS